MRVILVGAAERRSQLRAELDGTIDVVAEFPTEGAARAAGLSADALLIVAAARPPMPNGAPSEGSELVEEPLTPREVEVLELLAEGLSNKAIADRLRISDQTVKFHVASLSGKLGAANRTAAVRRGVRRGLVSL